MINSIFLPDQKEGKFNVQLFKQNFLLYLSCFLLWRVKKIKGDEYPINVLIYSTSHQVRFGCGDTHTQIETCVWSSQKMFDPPWTFPLL